MVDPLPESIRLGRIDLAAQRLIAPPGKNALERFQFALSLDPKSRGAKQGIVDIAKKFIELADKAGGDKAVGGAALTAYTEQLDHAADVAKLAPEGADVLKDVAARRHKAAEPLLAQAKASADKWDKPAAKAAYDEALKVDPDSTAARDGLKFIATIGEPGFVFRDKLGDAGAPPMVVLPGAGIAMARHPVTRAEFRRFWDGGGRAEFSGKEPSCRDRESIFRSSKKRGWENPDITQDDSHPVVCVGWAEAAAYAQWLGRQTGKRYRLPTAADSTRLPRVRRAAIAARRTSPMRRSTNSSTAATAAPATTGLPPRRRWSTSRRSRGFTTSTATCASGSLPAATGRQRRPAVRAGTSASKAWLAVERRQGGCHGHRHVRR